FPGATMQLHWSFPDPAALTGTREERLAGTRKIRDQIRARIEMWCDEMCAVEPGRELSPGRESVLEPVAFEIFDAGARADNHDTFAGDNVAGGEERRQRREPGGTAGRDTENST